MGVFITPKLYQLAPFMYAIYCPGCAQRHVIPTVGVDESIAQGIAARWSYDNIEYAPTFMPSVHIKATGDWDDNGIVSTRTICHFFIKRGTIEYCLDSDHYLAGKTICMVKFPDYDSV